MNRRHLLAVVTSVLYLRAAGSKIRVSVQRSAKGRSAQDQHPALEITLFGDEPFPVRALDPVLEIGSVRLTNFRFSGAKNEILTFYTLGDEDLRPGALMALQYGNDQASRNELGNFRAPNQ